MTPGSGAPGAACEVPGTAPNIKPATAIAKIVRIVVFLSISIRLIMACTQFRRHRVRCFDGTGVDHGEADVYTRVQA